MILTENMVHVSFRSLQVGRIGLGFCLEAGSACLLSGPLQPHCDSHTVNLKYSSCCQKAPFLALLKCQMHRTNDQ